MAQSNQKVAEAFLQSFTDAFNAHNLDEIMSHLTEDCVFEASAGPDVDGEKFTGQAQVRKAFEDVFTMYTDARWNDPKHFISDDRGFSEWTFTGTRKDGTRIEVTGIALPVRSP